jgi:choline dehydrogenase
VLLIEAGRKDDYHWIHIPVGYLYCIGNPRTDWLYQTEADPGLNGRRCATRAARRWAAAPASTA